MRNKLKFTALRKTLVALFIAASLVGCSLFVSLDDLTAGSSDAGADAKSQIDSAIDDSSVPDSGNDSGFDAGGPYLLVDTCEQDPDEIIDLTTQGTTDWVHWGADGDTKNISSHVLGTLMQSAAGNDEYGDDSRTMSWTDGTNVGTVSNSTDGTYDDLGPVTLTVQAASEKRILTVFLSTYSTSASFAISSSTGVSPSMQPLTGIVFQSVRYRCTVHFASPTAATITMTYSLTDFVDGGGGNLALMGASVAPDPN